MKEILFFGDSNTYGYTEPNEARLGEEIRWTGRLAKALGSEYQVIEAGLNGRAAGPYRDLLPERDGLSVINWYLDRYPDLSAVAVMLGTNDVGYAPLCDVMANVRQLLQRILTHPRIVANRTKVILITPVPMDKNADPPQYSHQLAGLYRALCGELCVINVDAGKWGIELIFDGCHISEEGHRVFALKIEKFIRATV